jgi:hypothetical protein
MKQVMKTTALILVAVLIAGFATQADAGTQDKNKALMMSGSGSKGAGSFTVTAQYLGSFEGRIRVGGKTVHVPSNTPVYVVGKGLQENSYFSNDDVVYVTGVRRGDRAIAKMIVVRPGESHTRRNSSGKSSSVGEYADDTPN